MKKHDIAEKDVEIRHHRLGDDTDPDRPDRRGERLDHQHHDLEAARARTRIDLRLWGRRRPPLRACPTTPPRTRSRRRPTCWPPYTRAASRGWEYALKNPEKAVAFLIKEYPNLTLADEIEGSKALLTFAFNANNPGQRLGRLRSGRCGRKQITPV